MPPYVPPQQDERAPGADVQCNHPPRLRHPSAKFALPADGLAKDSDISRKQGEDGRPIAEDRIHPAAVCNTGENDDIGNTIGQIVQDFAARSWPCPRRSRPFRRAC